MRLSLPSGDLRSVNAVWISACRQSPRHHVTTSSRHHVITENIKAFTFQYLSDIAKLLMLHKCAMSSSGLVRAYPNINRS